MRHLFGKIARDIVVFCFQIVSKIMRQKPHLNGREHLNNLPSPVIFSLTHDSYYEIPSLFKIYNSVKPSPVLTFLAKADFLSGEYLSTNFGKRNRAARFILLLLDKTRIPKGIFRLFRLTTIHRPFLETYQQTRSQIKQEIKEQMDRIRDGIHRGFTTIVFPEGTTWGFGGLKKIRSSVYQLVENTYREYKRKTYVLPINVKVDRLLKGRKDIFINIGKPVFFRKSKDEFNRRLHRIMQRLHTITFSQLAAYYLKYLADEARKGRIRLELAADAFADSLEPIVNDVALMVKRRVLPEFDTRLLDRKFLRKKAARFLKYCLKQGYLITTGISKRIQTFSLNCDLVLAEYSARQYRKLNPLGFHANELISLGEDIIKSIYARRLDIPGGGHPTRG